MEYKKLETLENIEWDEFNLKNLFTDVQRGKRLTKKNQIEGNTPYVSSSEMNNGVDNFISNNTNARRFNNCLSIANSGSVGSSFYEQFEFVASDHITHLKNESMNKYVYLFIATLTNRLKEKYNFNREINDERISKEKIILPINKDGQPDYEYMEEYVKEQEYIKNEKYVAYIKKELENVQFCDIDPTQIKEWKTYCIDDIFNINSGVRLTKGSMTPGRMPFIGASDSNNGITKFISNTNRSLDQNVLGVNYNGSVVNNFYHPYQCLFTDDVKRFSLKACNGNKFIYLFLKTSILQQKNKYQYGYKFNEKRMKKQNLLLPINKDGQPDYEYMEQYSKNLMIKKYNEYLEFIKKDLVIINDTEQKEIKITTVLESSERPQIDFN